jgi:DNA-binding response OmpR family regulator
MHKSNSQSHNGNGHHANGANGHNNSGHEADSAYSAKHKEKVAAMHPANTVEADGSAYASDSRNRDSERRRRSRVKVSAPVRIRPVNSTGEAASEVTSTFDVSRNGIRFTTSSGAYMRGEKVAIVFPYSNIPGEVHAEQIAQVVRMIECPDGSTQVAVSFECQAEMKDEAARDSSARQNESTARPSMPLESVPQKEYASAGVLVVEPDERARQTICSYLINEGYKVVGVGGHMSAREILSNHVPALVVAEIEGEGMPGLDLCAHIKSERRLNRVPVILTTRSAYPSDYANAHRAGAIICMAKPFKQEKLGHMVRLLAPLKRVEDKNAASAKKVRSPQVVRSQQSTAKPAALRSEFKELCNEAVNEKTIRDSGRYDMSVAPEPVANTKKDSRSGLSSLKSLFKR